MYGKKWRPFKKKKVEIEIEKQVKKDAVSNKENNKCHL